MKLRTFLATAFATFAVLFGDLKASAQDNPELAINTRTYNTAIGVRAGETSGLTIKKFVGKHSAVEGIVGIWNHGFRGTLLFEQHTNGFHPSVHWYYGLGGHASVHSGPVFHNHGRGEHHGHDHYQEGDLGLGVDGIVGLEWKPEPVPFAFSFDLKPFVEFNTGGYVWTALDPGLGIKVTF